jgi:hypothetical protein
VGEVTTRRCERAVSKLSLDHVHRLALGCEFGRECVSESVGVNSLLDPGLCGQSLHQVSHIARIDRLPLKRAKEARSSRESEFLAFIDPAPEGAE